MRRSLHELEKIFHEEIGEDRKRRASLKAHTEKRARSREIERSQRQGTLRFILLVVVLIATAVATAVVMFEILLLVMD